MVTEGVKPLTEEEANDIAKPVDFSFKFIERLKDVAPEGPRSTRIGKVPNRGSKFRKYLTRGIWMNNNKLTSLQDCDVLVNKVLEQPQKLSWLDFSFNFITDIHNSLLSFPNLKILYLHGNLISNIDEVLKLRALPELRTLTFHGNPIAAQNEYRNYVVSYLPQIFNLDFSPITINERARPKPHDANRKIENYETTKPVIKKVAAATE